MSSSGELWRLKNGTWQGLGGGLDAASPLAIGHGRVAGRAGAGLERWAREGRAGVAVLLQDGSVAWPAIA